jgi:D-glycero-D-manno-heptose 1,7-bisphosphate phosphatase
MKRAVFLDRDGTINEQMGYINHISRFRLLPKVAEAIRMLNENDYLVVVVTNQSGPARGYFPIELVHEVNRHMQRLLKNKGANVDAVYFCPHLPEDGCNCRKPKTGMIEMACRDMEIDLSRSYVVGDMCDDIELAKNAGIKGIMVKTGYGLGEIEYRLPKKNIKPDYIADDLFSAVTWILENDKRR